jgi:hypothetical protein
MQPKPYLVSMNARINQLVKSLLQKESLEQCSLQELQQFAERHPYFGAAQLLLTKKLQTEKSEQYDDQLQKTYLFFHNPLWVEHLLNDTGTATIKAATKKAMPVPVIEEIAAPPIITETAPAQQEDILADVPAYSSGMHESETAGAVSVAPDITEPISETTAAEVNNTPVIIEPIRETATAAEVSVAPLTPESVSETSAEEDVNNAPVITDPIKEESNAPSIEIPSFRLPPMSPVSDKDLANELVFEPYHTVDYFASQGIKFKEEERPKDKFGIQLKSFTDWLKTMKRLPQAEISKIAESSEGVEKVDQLALNSLQEPEIITEAMAEVWEKQGNYAKAIIIYHKLSLLEPLKSPYFAAKIEDLKKLN